jgi:hypothetical protein
MSLCRIVSPTLLRKEPVRAFATRAVAFTLIAWVTLRVATPAMLLAIGVRPVSHDEIGHLVERYESLAGAVPAGTVVGYASAIDRGDPAAVMHRMLARYALVPVIVDDSSSHRLMLADFDSDAALEAYRATGGATIQAHPADGLALVMHRGPE